MKLQKITNPQWLLTIAPKISEYAKYLKEQHISYEALASYIAMSVQAGRRIDGKPDTSEFWVVSTEGKPRAFAHWFVRPIPHIGKVYLDGIYSWAKTPKVIHLLLDEFLEFGKRHRCSLYEADAVNEKVYGIFEKYADEKGYEVARSTGIHGIAKKRRE